MIKLILFFSVFIFTHTLAQSKKQIDSISNLPMTYVQTNLNTVIPLLKKNIHFAHTSQNKTAEAKTSALLALAYYYNGDYYDIDILPDGQIGSFYKRIDE